ncbi:MAG: glycosyltransferase family 2 protein [Patescibacteria group bacterium]
MESNKTKTNSPRLSISLVTYNSAADLPNFFESLEKQTFTDFEVIVVDNASSDTSCEYLEQCQPNAKIIKNLVNEGYAKAHNRGIREARAPYVLVANPDICLDENYLMEAFSQIEADERIASAGGKLYKLNSDLKSAQKSGMLDSTGFMCFKNRRIVDRGEGEKDAGQYDASNDVFGISGALVLFNKRALDDVQLSKGQYFDESYFMYQEDFDLAWRLKLRGWKSRYVPKAVAWHRRSAQSAATAGTVKQILHRRTKSALMNQWSYRNHLATIIKNESFANIVRCAPWLVSYEIKKFFYLIFFEPRTIIQSFQIWSRLPVLLRQRREILSRRIISDRDLRQWFL